PDLRIAPSGDRHHRMCLSGIPLPAGEKRLSAAAKRPSNTEKTLYISGLSTIWPSPPAAEFMRLAADWQRIGSGLAAEFGSRGGTAGYAASGGGSNALTRGSGPSKRSISTRLSCPVQPCARREVPASRVRTFGLPCTQSGFSAAGSSGSYQAPVDSWTTPGRSVSLSTAPARHA